MIRVSQKDQSSHRCFSPPPSSSKRQNRVAIFSTIWLDAARLRSKGFPNASRNYNPTQRCVCFWGHDSAFEVSFHLDEEALCKISPYVDRNEASLLHVFDVNRVRIQEAASVAYSRRRQNYHRLSASDLLEPVHRRRKHG